MTCLGVYLKIAFPAAVQTVGMNFRTHSDDTDAGMPGGRI